MLSWLRNLLLGPKLTLEEKMAGIRHTEARLGVKVFHLDGPTAFQFIKEHGFPVRGDDGLRN